MKIPEIPRAAFLLVQVAESDVQPHGTVAELGRIEFSRCDFETWVKADRPFENVPLATRLRLGRAVHGVGLNPALVRRPGLQFRPRFAFHQAGRCYPTQPRLRQITNHLPTLPVAGGVLLGRTPLVGGVHQDLHLIAEPREPLSRQFVGFGIVVGQPTRRIDSVQHVVRHVESEVQPLAIVLDVALHGEILRVRHRGEGGNPTLHPLERCGVSPFPSRQYPVHLRGLPGERFHRLGVIPRPSHDRHCE